MLSYNTRLQENCWQAKTSAAWKQEKTNYKGNLLTRQGTHRRKESCREEKSRKWLGRGSREGEKRREKEWREEDVELTAVEKRAERKEHDVT